MYLIIDVSFFHKSMMTSSLQTKKGLDCLNKFILPTKITIIAHIIWQQYLMNSSTRTHWHLALQQSIAFAMKIEKFSTNIILVANDISFD